jgi:hypothetical protein
MVRGGFILRLVAMFLFVALSSFFLIGMGFAIARGLPATRILVAGFFSAVSVGLLAVIIRIHLRATPLTQPPPKEDTLRNRAADIGCGAFALIFAGFFIVFAIAALFAPSTHRGEVIVALIIGAFFGVVALITWLNAVRSYTGGDDDIFSGTRGTALSIVIVIAVVIAGVWIRLGLDLEFWRGMIQGIFEASR